MGEKEDSFDSEILSTFYRFRSIRVMPFNSVEGLTPTESVIVAMLAQHIKHSSEPMTVGELGKCLHISPSALSQRLRSLENKRIITRRRSSQDSRVVEVYLAEKGTHAAQIIRERAYDAMYQLEEYLGEQDVRDFSRILGRIESYISDQVASGAYMSMSCE